MDTRSQPQSEADKADLTPADDGQTSQLTPQEKERPILRLKIATGAVVVIVVVSLYWALSEAGVLSILSDERTLREWIVERGLWGPLAIVALITVAIVMSPIPSGPIAIISGAVYGPLWGTVYVVAGAELGALVAFSITRCLGYETVRRWPSAQLLLCKRRQHEHLRPPSRHRATVSFEASTAFVLLRVGRAFRKRSS